MPFCHNGCPLGQPDPRLERPRLPRPLAGRDPPAARDEQLPGVHRAPVPGAVRGRLRAGDPRGRRGDDQADRELDHRPRLGRGLGRARSRPQRETGQRRRRRRRRARPAWPPPSSCAAPATASCCSSATRPPAAWSASACRTSRSRSASSSAASQQLRDEGVELRCGVDVGVDVTVEELREEFDAVVLATGSRVPRDLPVAGPRARRRALRDGLPLRPQPLGRRRRRRRAPARSRAAGKHVVVIGGGDTGADCVGNSIREGALSGHPARAAARAARAPRPTTARRGRCGRRSTASPTRWRRPRRVGKGEQDYSITTTHFAGDDGRVTRAARRPAPTPRRRSARSRAPSASCRPTSCCWRWASCTPSRSCSTSSASPRTRAATSRPRPTRRSSRRLRRRRRRRGQSLIVWAINEGRQCARDGRPLPRRRVEPRELVADGQRRARRRGPRGPAARPRAVRHQRRAAALEARASCRRCARRSGDPPGRSTRSSRAPASSGCSAGSARTAACCAPTSRGPTRRSASCARSWRRAPLRAEDRRGQARGPRAVRRPRRRRRRVRRARDRGRLRAAARGRGRAAVLAAAQGALDAPEGPADGDRARAGRRRRGVGRGPVRAGRPGRRGPRRSSAATRCSSCTASGCAAASPCSARAASSG